MGRLKYLKDRFNYEYLILRFGYPAHFAGTNNCGIANYNNWGEPERAHTSESNGGFFFYLPYVRRSANAG